MTYQSPGELTGVSSTATQPAGSVALPVSKSWRSVLLLLAPKQKSYEAVAVGGGDGGVGAGGSEIET
jgi:hypothetical protein